MERFLRVIRRNYDKILHVSVSALLTMFINAILHSNLFTLIVVFIIGISWEYINDMLFEVQPSVYDVFADIGGIVLGLAMYYFIIWRVLC